MSHMLATWEAWYKYRHFPETEVDATPWAQLCVDLIDPYTLETIKNDNKINKLTFWAVTIIDPAMEWSEVKQLQDKEQGPVAYIVQLTWLTRYLCPSFIVYYDNETELSKRICWHDEELYGIK